MTHREIQIAFNDYAVTDENQPILIYPGRENTLRLTWTPRVGVGECRTVVEIVAPDGRRNVASHTCHAGRTCDLPLGRFAVPAAYEFEAGVVYRRGYRINLTLTSLGSSTPMVYLGWYQGLTRDRDAESFYAGYAKRVVFNDGYIPASDEAAMKDVTAGGETSDLRTRKWYPFDESGRPMDPPIELCLAPAVLVDQDQCTVRFRSREKSPEIGEMDAELVVQDAEGREVCPPAKVVVKPKWQEQPLQVAEWPTGEYSIELRPQLEGEDYDGPVLVYRRQRENDDEVQVSPLASSLRRIYRVTGSRCCPAASRVPGSSNCD